MLVPAAEKFRAGNPADMPAIPSASVLHRTLKRSRLQNFLRARNVPRNVRVEAAVGAKGGDDAKVVRAVVAAPDERRRKEEESF